MRRGVRLFLSDKVVVAREPVGIEEVGAAGLTQSVAAAVQGQVAFLPGLAVVAALEQAAGGAGIAGRDLGRREDVIGALDAQPGVGLGPGVASVVADEDALRCGAEQAISSLRVQRKVVDPTLKALAADLLA